MPSDAKVMEHLFAPALTAADLQALDAYSVAAIVALDNGSQARPVTLNTPPPPLPSGLNRQARTRQLASALWPPQRRGRSQLAALRLPAPVHRLRQLAVGQGATNELASRLVNRVE